MLLSLLVYFILRQLDDVRCVTTTKQIKFYFDRKPDENALQSIDRLFHMLKAYELDTRQKIVELGELKSMVESSSHYETGYLVSEIIEKFRLMVKETAAAEALKSNELLDYLVKASSVQNYYLEIWHLCMMLHEIPPKYGNNSEDSIFMDASMSKANRDEIKKFFQEKREKQVKDQEEKKRKQKDEKDRQDIAAIVEKFYPFGSGTTKKRNSSRSWWPIEYGWEIDSTWYELPTTTPAKGKGFLGSIFG